MSLESSGPKECCICRAKDLCSWLSSALSMKMKSTTMDPCTVSLSYGRGCNVSVWVTAGPAANSSMPTKPKPKNLGALLLSGADVVPPSEGMPSYTSNRISAVCGSKSLPWKKIREFYQFPWGNSSMSYNRKCSSQLGFGPARPLVWFFCGGSSISMTTKAFATSFRSLPDTIFTRRRRPEVADIGARRTPIALSASFCVRPRMIRRLNKGHVMRCNEWRNLIFKLIDLLIVWGIDWSTGESIG